MYSVGGESPTTGQRLVRAAGADPAATFGATVRPVSLTVPSELGSQNPYPQARLPLAAPDHGGCARPRAPLRVECVAGLNRSSCVLYRSAVDESFVSPPAESQVRSPVVSPVVLVASCGALRRGEVIMAGTYQDEGHRAPAGLCRSRDRTLRLAVFAVPEIASRHRAPPRTGAGC